MQYACLPLAATHAFSALFLDYLEEKPALQPFYRLAPRLENFAEALAGKILSESSRQDLVAALRQQYANLPDAPHAQIEALLQPNTFTVTTGHQLCLYTGPMYFVLKILTTIRLAEALKEAYPAYNFVPVYWLASEDHDFAEVNHFHLFGKQYTWESAQRGAVGRFSTGELAPLFAEMQERMPAWENAYLSARNLSEATRNLVHELFGKYGLVTLDADDVLLKKALRGVMAQDIFEQKTFAAVSPTNDRLAQAGYKAQVNPREINFFYLRDGFRERIVQNGDQFQTTNGEYTFTEASLRQEIETNPEYFSPNVLLRPVYQELILPNLAYIGGPGELAYWLQMKEMFESYAVPMPILFPRNFGAIISKTLGKKIGKLNLSVEELFLPEAEQKARIIAQTAGEPLTIDAQRHATEQTFAQIAQIAEKWDKSLVGAVEAEHQKTLKSLENLEKRLRKAQETKAETELKQLASVREKLFPQGGLQERHENILNFMLNQPEILHTIYQSLSAFNHQFYVWQEQN